MLIHNTLTNKKEELLQKKINMFVCGPTVYGPIHIGNARTVMNFDIIVKYLRSRKYKVFYLQNITDIDDKIIKKAAEENTKWNSIAKRYTQLYLQDMKKLGITAVTAYEKATQHIPEIINQVKTLLAKGYAYKIKDGYYFDISKFEDYGKLAKRTAAEADDGVSRIDENNDKKNKGDFCLWKFKKEGEPSWKSPLGEGRPGWHIEDTAITEHVFGPQYDIHGGGTDLIFPHHEAEIAQQEAASGKKPFVKYWMHTGMIQSGGRKMSKSLGNFLTLEDFLKNNSPLVFRLTVALHHYRSTLDIGSDTLLQSKAIIASLLLVLTKLKHAEKNSKNTKGIKIENQLKTTEMQFHEGMENDFNTPKAFSALFGLVSFTEKNIWNLNKTNAKKIRETLQKLLSTFDITMKPTVAPKIIENLAKKRLKLRDAKRFEEADKIRDQIIEKGYTILDTPHGPLISAADKKIQN